MGKIKTVVMGDLEAEERARKKAEAKREAKKAEKKSKDQPLVLGDQLSDASSPVVSSPVEETEPPKTDKPKSDLPAEAEKTKEGNRKPRTDNRYKFVSGKKYVAAKSLVEAKKLYSLTDALGLVKKTSYSKFDGSVEIHFNLTDKNLRGNVTLPHGTGKQIRVKIADDALVANPIIDFDILVATPAMMPKLAKIAKILGPKGLMPNPKTNTISDDPEKLVKSLSSSLSWKTQPDFPIVHAVIGKVSFENEKLEENFTALTKSIGRDKIKSVFLKATMGPAVKVEV